MIRITCPFCGTRDHTEFTYEGDATVKYPELDASQDAWFDAVFLRENPRGWHREYWRHAFGCGLFLEVTRHTVTHEIKSVKIAHPGIAEVMAPEKDSAEDPAPDTTPDPAEEASS